MASRSIAAAGRHAIESPGNAVSAAAFEAGCRAGTARNRVSIRQLRSVGWPLASMLRQVLISTCGRILTIQNCRSTVQSDWLRCCSLSRAPLTPGRNQPGACGAGFDLLQGAGIAGIQERIRDDHLRGQPRLVCQTFDLGLRFPAPRRACPGSGNASRRPGCPDGVRCP